MRMSQIVYRHLVPIVVAGVAGLATGYMVRDWLAVSIVAGVLTGILTPQKIYRLLVNSVIVSLIVFTLPGIAILSSRESLELLDILARAVGTQGTVLLTIIETVYLATTVLVSTTVFSVKSALAVARRRESLL